MAKAATTKARQVSWEELSAGLAGQVPSRRRRSSARCSATCSPGRGSVWLSSIVQLVSAFGLEASHVRTAALRLVYDGWLDAVRSGKYSYYSLSKETFENTRDYFERVYGEPRSAWDGSWQIVLFEPDNLDKRVVADLKLRLQWLGFGPFAPNLYAAPGNDPAPASTGARVEDRGQGADTERDAGKPDGAGAHGGHHPQGTAPDAVEAGYRDFIALFGPVQAALSDGAIPRQPLSGAHPAGAGLSPHRLAGSQAAAAAAALLMGRHRSPCAVPRAVFPAPAALRSVSRRDGADQRRRSRPVSDEVLRRFGGAPSAAPALQGRRRAAKAPAA